MRKNGSLVGIAIVLGLVASVGVASPALADSWRYPGGVSCTGYTARTWSQSVNGTQAQHRAEGYLGYYYKNWGTYWWTASYQGDWGYKTILSSRVGVTGNGTVYQGAVTCSPI